MPSHEVSAAAPVDQGFDCFRCHVGGEQEEADRDPFLGAPLGSGRQCPTAGEPPDYDDTGKALDRAIEPEGDKGDRSGRDTSDNADCSLDAQPRQRERRQSFCQPREAQPRGAAGRDIDIGDHE